MRTGMCLPSNQSIRFMNDKLSNLSIEVTDATAVSMYERMKFI